MEAGNAADEIERRALTAVGFYEDSTVKLPHHGGIWFLHPKEVAGRIDPRSGTVEGSRVWSSELLSVQDATSSTTCCMRARRTGNPRSPTRPFFADGHSAVTRW